MRPNRFLSFIVFFSVLVPTAAAQDFWVKKPYTEWSQREVQRMLRDSPWARRWVMQRAAIVPIGRETAMESADRAGERTPEVTYTVQIRSALPMRQALVRISQIEQGNDMPREQLERWQRAHQNLLQLQFAETVVLYVLYSSNIPLYDRELAHYWHGQTTETLLDKVFLNTPGGRLPLLAYSHAPGATRAFQLTFPRFHEGQPIIPEGSKQFSLEFHSPELGGTAPPDPTLPPMLTPPSQVPQRDPTPVPGARRRGEREQRVVVTFPTRKMVIDGKLVY